MATNFVYRTPLLSRLLDTSVALAFGLGLGLLAVLFPVGIAFALVDEQNLNPILVLAITLPVVILGIRFAWSVCAYRMRASVIFHERYVQVGEGMFSILVPFGEIEEITLPNRGEGNWLKMRIGGQAIRVVLNGDDLLDSLNLLTELCQNAVIISPDGTEYVSPNASPDFSLPVLQRRYRRIAFGSLLATVFFSLILAGRIWVAIQWKNGVIDLSTTDHCILWSSLPLAIIASGASVIQAIQWYRNSRALLKQRLSLDPPKYPQNVQIESVSVTRAA